MDPSQIIVDGDIVDANMIHSSQSEGQGEKEAHQQEGVETFHQLLRESQVLFSNVEQPYNYVGFYIHVFFLL
jgi:hypothetical protein